MSSVEMNSKNVFRRELARIAIMRKTDPELNKIADILVEYLKSRISSFG